MYVKVTGSSEQDFIRALKIFTKKVKDSGVIQEVYARREYVKPSLKRKLKAEEAFKRKIREEKKLKRNKN